MSSIEAITYWGPSHYSKRPCVAFTFEERTTDAERHLIERCQSAQNYLTANLSYRKASEKIETLKDAFTFIAHASLFILNYVRGDLSEHGYIEATEKPTVYIEFHSPKLTVKALEIVLSLGLLEKSKHETTLGNFWDECQRIHPDFQAHTLITAAKKRGLYYTSVGGGVWLYGSGELSRAFFETSPVEDMEQEFQADKLSGKMLFEKLNIPTADYEIAENYDEVIAAAQRIGFPCAIKPIASGSGKGVTANIQSIEEVSFAFSEASKHLRKSKKIIIERFIDGRDYRLLVVNGRYVGCASSSAPSIIGDGTSTVGELIAEKNRKRSRNLYASGYLRPINIDASVIETLTVQKLDLDSILPAEKQVTLRRNTNLGGGGSTEIFDNVHPTVVNYAEKIARSSGLYSVGVDYISKSIEVPPEISNGKFTELNRTPGVPLFIAAGYDINQLGDTFLGPSINNIPINLYILRPSNMQKFFDSYSGKDALFLPNILVRKGKVIQAKKAHFSQLLIKTLADRSLTALDIIGSDEFMKKNGFPTEHLSKIVIENLCMSNFVKKTIDKLESDPDVFVETQEKILQLSNTVK